MARNQEGELELVLGNKQLLSVFFIVVVLLGVFFTMGYIVGRNSSETARQAAPGQPLVVTPAPPPVRSARPAKQAPEKPPSPAAAHPPASPPPARAARQTPPLAPSSASAPPPAPAGVGNPAPGQVFLQVAATSRAEGRVLLDVLAKRGFSGRLAPVPGQELFRVLVGPLHGADQVAATRARLRAAGFKPFLRKY